MSSETYRKTARYATLAGARHCLASLAPVGAPSRQNHAHNLPRRASIDRPAPVRQSRCITAPRGSDLEKENGISISFQVPGLNCQPRSADSMLLSRTTCPVDRSTVALTTLPVPRSIWTRKRPAPSRPHRRASTGKSGHTRFVITTGYGAGLVELAPHMCLTPLLSTPAPPPSAAGCAWPEDIDTQKKKLMRRCARICGLI